MDRRSFVVKTILRVILIFLLTLNLFNIGEMFIWFPIAIYNEVTLYTLPMIYLIFLTQFFVLINNRSRKCLRLK